MSEQRNDPSSSSGPANADSADSSRRGFLTAGIGLLGAGLAATAVAPALGLFAHPLRHPTTTGSDDFIFAGKLDLFAEASDEPVKVDLYADKVDAWNRVVEVKVGSAWVIERGGKLVAYSTVCPHLGCGIDFDASKSKFLCACHKSWFSLDGVVEDGPSPRGLDELEVDVDEKQLAIRYQRFKQGTSEKEPIG